MRTKIITLLVLISAFFYLRAEILGLLPQIYIFKPLTLLLIISMAMQAALKRHNYYGLMIIVGLLFSLAGDILLMLPYHLFLFGLIAFLIAHIWYILAFSSGRKVQFWRWSLLFFLSYGIFIFLVLFPSVGKLKLPVLMYVLVILIMGWQAYERWNEKREVADLLAFCGALFFILSDTVLAINRFIESFAWGRVLNLSTYFMAQWLIARSIDFFKGEPPIAKAPYLK
jgi:uncharacterized membrane protein YhhN